jgi:hypothetical protein
LKAVGVLLLCSLVFALTAAGQSRLPIRAPEIKLGAEYVLLHTEATPSDHVNMQGLQLDATGDFFPRIGLTAQLAYTREANALGTTHHYDTLTYLAGPVFYPLKRPRYDVYMHGLAGGARVSGPIPEPSGGLGHGYASEFSYALGGGAEIKFMGPFLIRVGADYLRTKYFNPLLQLQNQNDIRATVGIVYGFVPGGRNDNGRRGWFHRR